MKTANQIQEFLDHFGGIMLISHPILFGTIEFIKENLGFEGRAVELMAVGIFTLFGALVVVPYYYPENGVSAAAVILFLLMYALALSGFDKFMRAGDRSASERE